ncbi:uncharacterized protein [Apostichopus japonicus]|uniref:uncharacterized protein n=1 Tax=Stichopus japonicus TaxID=307972 RepID=UPI003AB77D1C
MSGTTVILCTYLVLCVLYGNGIASELSEEVWLKPGESVDLSCRAEILVKIYPHISTRWTKGNDHIAPSEFIELIPNGGLRLLDLRITDSGVYVCQGKVPVQQGIVSVNIVKLHVGTSIQEQLLQQGGPWLSNHNSFGIPNVWVASFIGSVIVCIAFGVSLFSLRLYYKTAMKKYKKKAQLVDTS